MHHRRRCNPVVLKHDNEPHLLHFVPLTDSCSRCVRLAYTWSIADSLSLMAQATRSAPAEKNAIPALLVSDIHFDPFHDPAKVKELVAAPVSKWRSILSAPPSSNQAQAFEDLQRTCHVRGVDTPFALLRSSMQAMRSRQPDAKFMTVSGDLVAHGFDCRYSTLFPDSTHDHYQDFVVKTIRFVMDEIRAEFPAMPIYVALGNNDSGCGDYQLDTGSEFLAQAGRNHRGCSAGLAADRRAQGFP